jgi:uncharacterized integral membrane protein (TIGR00697 family)
MISNELILLIHSAVVVALVFIALRLGKTALTCFVALFGVLANLFILKQVTLFGLHVTCTDVFMIGQLFALNVLQEYYDSQTAKKAISISVFASVSTVILGLLHLMYAQNEFDTTHSLYNTILTPIPRIMLASIAVDFVAAHVERFVYSKLSDSFNKRFFGLRNALTMGLSQIFDTVVFSYAGLYGIVQSVPHIIVASLIVKGALIVGISLLGAGTNAALTKK